MKENLRRVFYLMMLGVMVYAPSVAALSCKNNNAGDVVLTGSKEIIIDAQIPNVVSLIIQIIRILIPVILVILGMIDLFKGVTAQKEDEMKKAQGIFVKRLIAAVLVFFVITIVKLVISFANSDNSTNIMDCADCFINGKCSSTKVNTADDDEARSKAAEEAKKRQNGGTGDDDTISGDRGDRLKDRVKQNTGLNTQTTTSTTDSAHPGSDSNKAQPNRAN